MKQLERNIAWLMYRASLIAFSVTVTQFVREMLPYITATT